eukprot:CAMPEP_0115161852 /NCGR_PEP_ID=MMETSP0227-20121206/71641_1 /TAXON_ID=89957 /ORGANISM="Polarella glacialis, Strain CCMP 1383" /LENGTH=50 /DNA_ID=CAMNT_0002574007 /DNA_START=385 /DNA_END=533 /DNA_ORIENTATION=-
MSSICTHQFSVSRAFMLGNWSRPTPLLIALAEKKSWKPLTMNLKYDLPCS